MATWGAENAYAIEIKPEIYDDRNTSIDFKSLSQIETINQIKNREVDGNILEPFIEKVSKKEMPSKFNQNLIKGLEFDPNKDKKK